MARQPETDQAEVVAALESGALTDGVRPERIDTHISHVFLTPRRAYKLKRAVTYNFVDQAASETRRLLCEEEVRLNRRTARDIYRGVRAIRRNEAGEFSMDGEGEIVDWLVEMRRFVSDDLLDAVAVEGRLTPVLAEQAAEALAALHLKASPETTMGHVADIRRTIRQLRHTEEDAAHAAGVEAAESSERLMDRLDAELIHLDPLIEQRRREGKVRRGHGDAHLGNIMLWRGKPTLFDALEFNARLATTDVVYDLAFLTMDLLHRGLKAEANAAMNAWWNAFEEDEAALALLPFFMALRAAVRMAVLTAKGDLVEAQSYRQVALGLLEHTTPSLVAIGGLSGVGKTTIARRLALHLAGPCGARHLRTDVLRKQGRNSAMSLPPEHYTFEHRTAVYQEMRNRSVAAIRAGASVLVDATFQADRQREEIIDCAGGAPFLGLWLTADLETRIARITARSGDASDADADVARSQEEVEDIGAGWVAVDASGTEAATLARAVAAVEETL